MTLAERFFHRFAGLERAHGCYKPVDELSSKGKQKGASSTVRGEGASVELFDAHLNGRYSLGIVPIRDDATCRFGAIDIDGYPTTPDLDKLAKKVSDLQLPMIICRSKSGGAHCFLFTSEDVSAELIRTKLMEWAVALGYSGVEVFPKQTRLAGANDVGNWINMPYYAALVEETSRYAVAPDGTRLSVKEFLKLADDLAVSASELSGIGVRQDDKFKELWDEAPPCLQSLASDQFGEGSRNNGLFNVAVYLKKRWGEDDWEHRLDEYNQTFMSPPLGHKEVASIVKSVNRKSYEYKCGEPPIASVCNRQICLTRKCGVGQSEGDPGVVFGTLVKLETDPPVWIWDVDGARLELTTSDLKDQARFHSKCIEALNKWPNMVKPKQWSDLVRSRLENVEVQEVPPDARPEGQMMVHLEDYCVSTARARSREELLQDKPWSPTAEECLKWKDVEEGRTYFRAAHFKQKLASQYRMVVTEKQLWGWLRKHGAQHHFFNIKGRGINCWSVPAFNRQTEDFAVPTLDTDEM